MMEIRKRKIKHSTAVVLSTLAALSGIFWLVFILFDVLRHGVHSIRPELFLSDPAPPGFSGGGLRNAFVGQILLTGTAIVIGVPIGILGGTFLSEYGRHARFGRFLSILSDIMISVPSIVVGSFVYAIMVIPMGQFSGWAGAVALSIIMLPIIVRTTEDMMSLVPWTTREAAFALGAPYHKVITQVVYRGAATGIFTGILLAVARIAGETAPLLFTSFNNAFFSTNMNESIPSLTVTIFQYAMGPYDDWHSMAWAASFVITVFILAITVLGKIILRWRYKT